MKVLSVVGARPQFIKAAVLSAEFARREWTECLVHTGQHYDFQMSDVFFDQLKLRNPDHFLEVGSASHGIQTGEMMKRLEPVIEAEQPACVVVYGDTNSTLAGALVAAKLKMKLAHVEAGLRSFNRDMPEEINRVVADHISTFLFAPTKNAAKRLKIEGVGGEIYVVGDLMVDLLFATSMSANATSTVLDRFDLHKGAYGLVTVHRASNTGDQELFQRILEGLRRVEFPIIFPVHPRTAPLVSKVADKPKNVVFCEPLSYYDSIALQENARVVITDSGGIQKEAYALGVPCVTLRDETEWIETLECGWNVLVGTDPNRIERAAKRLSPKTLPRRAFGDGNSATMIADVLSHACSQNVNIDSDSLGHPAAFLPPVSARSSV